MADAFTDTRKIRLELLHEAQERARETHERAIQLHELHALHATEHGDSDMARRAEERAARARDRLARSPGQSGPPSRNTA